MEPKICFKCKIPCWWSKVNPKKDFYRVFTSQNGRPRALLDQHWEPIPFQGLKGDWDRRYTARNQNIAFLQGWEKLGSAHQRV